MAQIDGVEIRLGRPIESDPTWIGQGEILEQIVACWLVLDETDRPFVDEPGFVPLGVAREELPRPVYAPVQ